MTAQTFTRRSFSEGGLPANSIPDKQKPLFISEPARKQGSRAQRGLLTISEAAKLLRVSPKTLRRWEKRGLIAPYRTNGNQRRYSLEELNRVKEGHPTPETPEKGFLSIGEAARQLGVSTKTLRRWDKQGSLSPIRTAGGQRRYTQESLDHVKARGVHVARHVRPQRIEPPKATDGVGRRPPRIRVQTLEEIRAPFRLRYALRKLAVITLAIIVAAQFWLALPPLTKKRLERAFSPGPISPIVDVNDIFTYKIGKAGNVRIWAKYLLEADNLVTKTFNLLETGVFNTVQLVDTIFFGEGKRYFINRLGDAALQAATFAKQVAIKTRITAGTALKISFEKATQTGNLTGVEVDFSKITDPPSTLTRYGVHLKDAPDTTATAYGVYVEGTNWDYGIYSADDLYVGGNTEIMGSTEIRGTLKVGDDTTISGNLLPEIDSTFDIGATNNEWANLYVNDIAAGTIISGDTTLSSLTVTGTSDLQGNVLDTTGNLTLNDTVDISGALDVTGATTLSDTLTVAGATTLSSTLDVIGATTLSSILDVSGNTTVGGDLSVTGTGTHSFAGTLDPDQVAAFTLTGNITGSGSPNITGIGQFSGTSFTDGTLTITGGNITNGGSLSFSTGTFSTSVTSPLHTGSGAVTLSSGGGAGLALDSASGAVTFATNDDLIPTLGAGDADIGASGTRWDNVFAVDGNFSGTVTGDDFSCTDCLDFTEFADNLTLDASTDIALGALTLSTSGAGALSFASTGQVSFAGNVDATAGLDVSGSALTSSAGLTVSAGGATISSGALAVNSGSITSTAATLVINAAGAVDIQDNLTADSLTTDTGGVSIAAAQSYTGAGAVTLSSGGANTLTIDTGGAAALNIGTTNQNALTLGGAGVNTTINGANIILGAVGDAATEAVRADRSLTFTQDTNVTITNSGVAQNLTADRSWTLGWTGLLSIARGGTNSSATPTAGGVAYGTGSAYAFTLAGNAGQPLLSGAAGTPTWGTLSVSYGGTGLSSLASGALLYGSGSSPMSTLGISSANYVLYSSGGTAPAWGTIGGASITDNSLDFVDFENTLDLDAPLALNQGTNTWTQNFTGTTTTGFSYAANSLTSGRALSVASTATGFTGTMVDLALTGDNAANTGTLFKVSSTGTLSAGTVTMVTNLGTGLSFRVNDETGDADTTPFVIDASGQVGIGLPAPAARLHVRGGDIRFDDSTDTAALFFEQSTGRLGLGTTGPSQELEISSASPVLRLTDDDSDGDGAVSYLEFYDNDSRIGYIGDTGSDDSDIVLSAQSGTGGGLEFQAGGSVAFTIQSDQDAIFQNGNVGIGTTGPGNKLSVVNNIGILTSSPTVEGAAYLNFYGEANRALSAQVISLATGTGELAFYTNGGATLGLYQDDSGNVGIGTTGPSEKLQVKNNSGSVVVNISGNVSADQGTVGNINFTNDAASTDDSIAQIFSKRTGANDAAALAFGTQATAVGGVVEHMRIDKDGNVGINDTTPSFKLDVNGTLRAYGITDSSDISLKKNVTPIDNALDRITRLQGINYYWKNEEYGRGLQMGLIAQDVEGIIPEIVNTDDEGYKSIQYGKLTALLVEGVKEQQNEFSIFKSQFSKEIEQLKLGIAPLSGATSSGNVGMEQTDRLQPVTEEDNTLKGVTPTLVPPSTGSEAETTQIEQIGADQTDLLNLSQSAESASLVDEEAGAETVITANGTLGEKTPEGEVSEFVVDQLIANEGIFEKITSTISAIFNHVKAQALDVAGKLTAKTAEIASLIANSIKTAVLEVTDTLTAKLIRTEQLEAGEIILDGKVLADTSTGEAAIKAGETVILIEDPEVTPKSKIFLTPLDSTNGQQLFVSKKEEKQFEVSLDTPLNYDLRFDYWVVN